MVFANNHDETIHRLLQEAGNSYRQAGEYPVSLDRYGRLLKAVTVAHGPHAPAVAGAHEDLGDVFVLMKDYSSATRHYEQMAAISEAQKTRLFSRTNWSNSRTHT